MKDVDFVIVTGLSGAGKGQTMQILEELNFFCIDNLPPSLLPRLLDLPRQNDTVRQYAIAIDIRAQEYLDDFMGALEWLDESGYSYFMIFLDCNDSVLIKRFSETRRLHPLVKGENNADSIFENITTERQMLADARLKADVIIDTTDLRPMDLRARLNEIYRRSPMEDSLMVDIFSFGYKYGTPIDADIIFDVRFINNPFYIEELRPLTGEDQKVAEYVLNSPVTQVFLEKFTALIQELISAYAREGKAQLTIGIGCTGGQHRSVAIAIELAKRLKQRDINARSRHRESVLAN